MEKGRVDIVRNIGERVLEIGMWLGGRMGNEREDFVRDIGERVRG